MRYHSTLQKSIDVTRSITEYSLDWAAPGITPLFILKSTTALPTLHAPHESFLGKTTPTLIDQQIGDELDRGLKLRYPTVLFFL